MVIEEEKENLSNRDEEASQRSNRLGLQNNDNIMNIKDKLQN